MGQILQSDSIGAVSHNSGIITLAASRLTVGGQQYTTSSITRTISTDVTLTANTLYMIFAVLVSGSIQLRISTNFNSVGPAGFTSWKLVGAFYSNGLTSVAFGSFVNIEGVPTTEWISTNLRIFGDNDVSVKSAAPLTDSMRWYRYGMLIYIEVGYYHTSTVGTAQTGASSIMIPQNLPNHRTDIVSGGGNSGNNSYFAMDIGGSNSFRHGELAPTGTRWGMSFLNNDGTKSNMGAIGTTFVNANLGIAARTYAPLIGWTTTPIKDL